MNRRVDLTCPHSVELAVSVAADRDAALSQAADELTQVCSADVKRPFECSPTHPMLPPCTVVPKIKKQFFFAHCASFPGCIPEKGHKKRRGRMPLSGIRPPSRLFLIRFYGIRQVLCNDYRSPLLFRIVLFSGSFFQCLQKDCNLFLFFFLRVLIRVHYNSNLFFDEGLDNCLSFRTIYFLFCY